MNPFEHQAGVLQEKVAGFSADCVELGNMTPATARWLSRIVDGWISDTADALGLVYEEHGGRYWWSTKVFHTDE